ncbi:precorrin-6y C5,15-methyltransferase (decarboxylating) subunit CbiE [Clostridium sp. Marseille-QA1073]
MVYIVGLGPGHKDYILPIADKTMENSDIVVGFGRAIKSIDHIKTPKLEFKSIVSIVDYISENKDKNISIIASGDPGFYGITEYIKKNYNGEIKVIPGISSFQYFMSKLNQSWHNVHLGSMHGREEDFLGNISKYSQVIFLTDNKNSPSELCRILYENNINCEVYVGENLSYEDEIISFGSPKELMKYNFGKLAVMYIKLK